MRLSCTTGCVTAWPLRDALPAVRDAGYEAVELSWAQVEREFIGARDPAAALSALLKEHDLTLSSLRVADMTATDQAELGEAVSVIREQMEFAPGLGLTAVSLKGGDRRQQSLEVLRDGLTAVLRHAEGSGITICLGNAAGNRIEQIEDLRWMFLKTGHSRLGVLNDTGQFHASSVNPRDVLREFGDLVGLMHLTDRIGKRSVPLGEGEMNVPAIVQHARDVGYDGWLVVDADRPDADGTLGYLCDAQWYLQSLLAAGAK